MRLHALSGLLALTLLAASCAEEDKTAPPPPFLEPVQSPTADAKITLEGSAEYGSTVRISGGASEVELQADRYTARFRAEVELKPDATNTLSATATDPAGNTSEAATVEVVHQTGYGTLKEISLELFRNDETTPLMDPVVLQVGDRLRAEATALDAAGNELGIPVLITTSIPGALLEGTTLAGLSRTGTYKVVGTAAGTNVFASREVTLTPGPATSLSFELSRAEAKAGEVVSFTATAKDAFGNAIPDATIEVTSSPALSATFTIPGSMVTQPQGVLASGREFVAYDLSSVAGFGYAFALTASVAGTALQQTATLIVRPASGASFSKLEFVPSGTSKTVAAGEDADYVYEVVDLYGNPTPTPIFAFTSAPGAVVIDDGVSGKGKVSNLTAKGTFTVNFFISGAGQKGNLTLSVGTAPPATLDLTSSTTLAAPNSQVKVLAQVRDAFGNVIACAAGGTPVLFSATGQSAGAVTATSSGCFNTAFEAIYTFTAEDNYVIQAAYTDPGSNVTVTDAVYVTVLSFDNAPPTVVIKDLQRNGVPCPTTPNICTVGPGDFIQFTVEANDNKALSEISYTAFFSTAGASGTLRSQRVLIPANATLPFTQAFSFNVPNAFLEDVPLTAIAIDAAANRANTPEYLLRVTLQTFGNRASTLVTRDTGGNVINNPEDVVVASNGDLFIANQGNDNVLRLASGATFPQLYANAASLGGLSPSFLALDPSGNLFVTDNAGSPVLKRISTSQTVVDYLDYTTGANLRGLHLAAPTLAKGYAGFNGPVDGDTLTIDGNEYEINNFGTCAAANYCVAVAFGATNAAAANAVSACINSGAGCTVGGAAGSAHPTVTSSVSTTGTVALVVAAKSAGAPGGSIAFTTTGCPRFTLNGSGNCPAPTTTLLNGFDETLMVAQEGGGGMIDAIFSFPLDFSAPFPKNEGDAVSGFDMTVGGIPHEQWGLSTRDLATATSRNYRDFAFYFPDVTFGANRLRGARLVDNAAAQAIFNSAGVNGGRPGCGDCIRGTNDPGTPTETFSFLWDVVAEPDTGCLLVSDAGNGNLYSVDVRNPAATDPLVSLVASGLNSPRGLDVGPDGRLYVAVRGADAIIALSPSPSTTDCF